MVQKKAVLASIRENEREFRKNLIIDSAMLLFSKMPFDKVGMRDIAAEAGISPASIYRYFANRDDLFVEALRRESQIIEQEIRHLKDSSPEVSIEQIAASFVKYLFKHSTFFEMMIYFMVTGKIGSEALEKFNEAERRLLNVFDEIFISIGATGEIRLLSHAFFASLNGILITFRNYPGRYPEDTEKHSLRLAGIIANTFRKAVS
ncbi:MAG: TetR/AcrR family transcriptional regulator [Desulfomonilaceae bacterium]